MAKRYCSIKAKRALDSHVPMSKEKERIATQSEEVVARALKGKRTGDNHPMDVILTANKRRHGIEVKTIIDGKHNKITMHKESLARKLNWAKKNRAQTHTVVVKGQHVYYRKGLGSFRLETMQELDSFDDLARAVRGEKVVKPPKRVGVVTPSATIDKKLIELSGKRDDLFKQLSTASPLQQKKITLKITDVVNDIVELKTKRAIIMTPGQVPKTTIAEKIKPISIKKAKVYKPPPKYSHDEKWFKSLSTAERRAISHWDGGWEIGGEYTQSAWVIRDYQRFGDKAARFRSWPKAAMKKVKAEVARLDRALDRSSPYKGTLWRGLSRLDNKTYQALIKSKTLEWDAISSASADYATAVEYATAQEVGEFTKNILFEIRVNKTGVALPNVGAEQMEVLLRKGARYRVKSVAIETIFSTVEDRQISIAKMILEEI